MKTDSDILNDVKLSRAADLFLHFTRLKRDSSDYNILRSALLLFCVGQSTTEEVYARLSAVLDVPQNTVEKAVRDAVSSTPRPIDELFDAAYAPPEYSIPVRSLSLPRFDDPDDTFAFIGGVFAYLMSVEGYLY